MKLLIGKIAIYFAITLLTPTAFASDSEHGHSESRPACIGFGPQAPRDIDILIGSNKQNAGKAPSSNKLNLCNIHFHKNAEHKSKAFAIYAGEGDGHGLESGYQCGISKNLPAVELIATTEPICKSEHGELKPGDTIEVHWVHSSCDVRPGATLGACLSASCLNPDLRVEAQVFTLVNDPKAMNFKDMDYNDKLVNDYHQAKSLPSRTGRPVEFIGSTTGPKYTEQACSPLQVTWSVRPQCAKLDINSLGAWCKSNSFSEDHAHGVRKLVTNPKLLSTIKN